jgi:hypothetical protein
MDDLILDSYYLSCYGVNKSHLLPISIFGIYLPQCNTNCSNQFLASLRDYSLVISKTTQAAFDRLK